MGRVEKYVFSKIFQKNLGSSHFYFLPLPYYHHVVILHDELDAPY